MAARASGDGPSAADGRGRGGRAARGGRATANGSSAVDGLRAATSLDVKHSSSLPVGSIVEVGCGGQMKMTGDQADAVRSARLKNLEGRREEFRAEIRAWDRNSSLQGAVAPDRIPSLQQVCLTCGMPAIAAGRASSRATIRTGTSAPRIAAGRAASASASSPASALLLTPPSAPEPLRLELRLHLRRACLYVAPLQEASAGQKTTCSQMRDALGGEQA